MKKETAQRECIVCGTQIPAGRLKIIPNTQTCVNHSTTSKFVANLISSGDPEKGELNQELEIIKEPHLAEQLLHYKNQMGKHT